MRFTDIYKKGFRYSLEVFPPKTEEGVAKLLLALKKLEVIDPAYVSVTYGAMGSTRELTKDLAFKIFDQVKGRTAFHFTCVGVGQAEIKKYVDALYTKGVDLVVALRGDVPTATTGFVSPANGFSHANELVSFLKRQHDFSIAVAGYPEKHPEALNLQTDIDHLKGKVDAGADLVITQLFFDNGHFFDWLSKIRQAGITVPVVPGVMPLFQMSQVKKIAEMSCVQVPQQLLNALVACGDDDNARRKVGIEWATVQCKDLIQNGVPGIHFYCLNKADSVLAIVENCSNCDFAAPD